MEQKIQAWYKGKYDPHDFFSFMIHFNSGLEEAYKVYLKGFWPKKKSEKDGTFYIATEGEGFIKHMAKKFPLTQCEKPDRTKISRFGGWTIEREWMK